MSSFERATSRLASLPPSAEEGGNSAPAPQSVSDLEPDLYDPDGADSGEGQHSRNWWTVSQV
jgi:hypothetical protein